MIKKNFLLLLSLCFLIFKSPISVQAAEDRPHFADEKLTGDWGGLRGRWFDKGLLFDMYYRAEFWRNVSGGISRGNRVLDDLDIKFTVDGEKAFGAEGTTFFLYFLNNNGGRPNDLVESHGGISNIEVPVRSFKLYEAWVQKEFLSGQLSVLLGLHDLNSEFYVTETSGLFLNPTYGIGTEMAATGDNGPSIFPNTGLAARVALHPTENIYVQTAIFDGVPGDLDRPRGTRIDLENKEGALAVAEGGVWSEAMGHFAVGGWKYTAGRPDQLDPTQTEKSKGIYFLADRSVYSHESKDISLFARFGVTDGDVESFKSNLSVGGVVTGFIPSRSESKIGLAVTRLKISRKFKEVNTFLEDYETQVELTYFDKIRPWLSVQPDLQYAFNPGTDVALKNAWTVGLRFAVDF